MLMMRALPLMLTLSLAFPCLAGDELKLLNGEQIGPLKIGLPAGQLETLISSKPKLGPNNQSEADGLYHQQWSYGKEGIILDMVSEKKRSPQTIGEVSVSSPCRFETKRGIRVGSTETEAEQVYRKDIDKESSQKGEQLVAGSPYGGLIFRIQKGKVANITLGAIAE